MGAGLLFLCFCSRMNSAWPTNAYDRELPFPLHSQRKDGRAFYFVCASPKAICSNKQQSTAADTKQDDKVAKDEFLKMTLGLAKPAGTRLLIKSVTDAATFLNDEKSRNLKILLIVNSVKDAFAMVNGVPEIKSVNFGGIRRNEGMRLISKAVAVNDEDITLVKELLNKGIELELRQVPTDKKQMVESLI